MNDLPSGPSVFISADMEGCASLVHWDEVQPGSAAAYARARRLLAAELNAALDGAFASGAGQVIVNDAHSSMRNLVLPELDARATLVSGRVKPLYMLQGIAGLQDALAFFVGYHGAIGDQNAVMGHTYSPRVIFECRLFGRPVGELTINAALAAHHGVPVALVSGDSTTLAEAERVTPWAVRVETKRSLSYFAAECRSPHEVQSELRRAGADAVRKRAQMQLVQFDAPIVMEIDTRTTAQADAIGGAHGFARMADRTIVFEGQDMPSVYRALVATIHLGAAA